MFDQPEAMMETKSIHPPSLLDGMKQRQMRLQSDLDKVNEAIDAMEKNPEIAIVIEKISKIRGI